MYFACTGATTWPATTVYVSELFLLQCEGLLNIYSDCVVGGQTADGTRCTLRWGLISSPPLLSWVLVSACHQPGQLRLHLWPARSSIVSGGKQSSLVMSMFSMVKASSTISPFTHSGANKLESTADPQPNVLNLEATNFPFSSTWICNFIISPYARARTNLVLAFFFKDFIYLFEIEGERKRAGTEGRCREREEADFALSRERNVGLNPRTLGSWPELKTDT